MSRGNPVGEAIAEIESKIISLLKTESSIHEECFNDYKPFRTTSSYGIGLTLRRLEDKDLVFIDEKGMVHLCLTNLAEYENEKDRKKGSE